MFSKIVILTIFLITVLLEDTSGTKTVEYYEKLFANYEQSAATYSFPKDNSDFFNNSTDDHVHDYGEFDFIIIGAGSAGTAIANRLSEISKWNILLIEAGGEEDDFSDIPGVFVTLQGSKMNWGYLTTPQTTCCLGMKNNQCVYPRGKVLGGSSTINALMYVRGNRKDYDRWEELGNKGWNYDEVLPYFIKSENSQVYFDDYHGNDGPMTVDYPRPPSSLLSSFKQANLELGRKYLDYNGREQLGFSRTQLNIKQGRRVSGGNAYIKPIRQRSNLQISTNSLVTKILTETTSEISAYGVEFVRSGITFRARARKELILSAGTINSPQILKLSGIGPEDELTKLNIPVVKNLPAVGENMKDHPVYIGLTLRTNYTEESKTTREMIMEYLNHRGSLTSAGPTYGVGFIETEDVPNGIPDIEYLFLPPVFVSPIPHIEFNPSDEMLENYFNKQNNSTDIAFYVILLHPKSSGRVSLKSASAKDFPEIDINYFSDKEGVDIETMYRGIQFILNLTKTDPFQAIQANLYPPVPLCNNLDEGSKDYWYCAIRALSSTLYHPTGTTRMGETQDNSVVDSDLKVHGVKNLRIADAGVMPTTISGHTNTAAFMIGERVSDFIKRDHGEW